MNCKQRYLETVLFGHPDHVPLSPGGPRESTLEAWHKQGLDANVPYKAALIELLGIPEEAFQGAVNLPVETKMIPQFEEEVLEHRDGHYIVRDWMGAITEISDEFDYTYIRQAKDFVTRKWHRFPVQTRDEWEAMKVRFDSATPERLGGSLDDVVRLAKAEGRPTSMYVNGPFWQMREWVGMENLCMLMVTDPAFVQDMADFWLEFTLGLFERVVARTDVDILRMSEDMAYKAHSMISPKMARRFLQPTYIAWRELLDKHNCAVYDMDSDGNIEELIPIWIESGFNLCDPIEVAAENDIVTFRQQFGQRMAYSGGVDKRLIAVGGQPLRDELERIIPPLFKDGGFIPSCDHGVPPDISWPNFVEYTRLLAQYEGWL